MLLSTLFLLLPSSPVALVRAQSQCPTPIISSPTPSQTLNTRFVHVSGTLNPSSPSPCDTVDLFLNGSPYPVDSSYINDGDDASFSFNVLTPVGSGQVVEVVSRPSDPASEYAPTTSEPRSFGVLLMERCTRATITPPDDYIVYASSLTLTGTYQAGAGAPTCDTIVVSLDGAVWASTTVTSSGGRWSATLANLPDGTHTATITSGTGSQLGTSENEVEFLIANGPCAPPTISTPTPGQILVTPNPTFGGVNPYLPHCLDLELEIGGETYYDYVQGRAWTWTVPGAGLAVGTYTVRARHTGFRGSVGWSDEVAFEIRSGTEQSLYPETKAQLRPAPTPHSVCSPGSDVCAISVTGQQIYECVPDLRTNLERCGSCAGPDCTQIPHAETVACVKGQCIVSACGIGFRLSDDRAACLPGPGPGSQAAD